MFCHYTEATDASAASGTRSDRPHARQGRLSRHGPGVPYGPRIQQLAFRYLKNWEDAEEVAQDVLLKVYRKIEAFRGDAALSSWIYRITFNTAMSRLRTARFSRTPRCRRPNRTSTGWSTSRREPADWTSLADDQVMRAEMRKKLIDALTHLPDGVSRAGAAARHPRVCRPKRRAPILQGEAADAEVAAAPRPADPAQAHGRVLADWAAGRNRIAKPRSTCKARLSRIAPTSLPAGRSRTPVRSCRLSAGSSVLPIPPFTISTGTAAIDVAARAA